MRRLAPAAFICLVLLMATDAFAQDKAVVAQGQKVYADQKCSICHSVGAVGNKKGPMEGVASKLTAAEIRQWITSAPDMAAKAKADRKPVMKAYANLTKEELDALVAYLQTLKK